MTDKANKLLEYLVFTAYFFLIVALINKLLIAMGVLPGCKP